MLQTRRSAYLASDIQKILSLIFIALAGCGKTSTLAIPSSNGDFVDNNDGVGTARVFGIDFSVRANSSGASTDVAIDATFVDPNQSSATKRFTLGNDITIELDSVDELEVRFMFNDQSFGTLNVGDKVVIEDNRNVKVNGIPRSPEVRTIEGHQLDSTEHSERIVDRFCGPVFCSW